MDERAARERASGAGGGGMDLIRPNGLVERLDRTRPAEIPLDGYGRGPAGAATPRDLQAAAGRDRRRRRRSRQDPLRGRLVDLTT